MFCANAFDGVETGAAPRHSEYRVALLVTGFSSALSSVLTSQGEPSTGQRKQGATCIKAAPRLSPLPGSGCFVGL